ncbi:MAG TPA: SNase-like nuclease [Cyanobacteria bacterium UBA11367]|nr:SNase-like nuclease [Cyanobacteria bacterium UBA11367]HBE56782.1 SNase-like nuclease [Cyanobacteria bacterium UBA11366]
MLKVKLISIIDGDTIKVLIDGIPTNIRFRLVDTPETQKHQTSENPIILNQWLWGKKAKEYIQSRLPSDLYIFIYETDIYGRTIGDIYTQPFANTVSNIQYKLALAGLCTLSLSLEMRKMNNRELALYSEIPKAIASAYRQKRGFWKDFEKGLFIDPYTFKKQYPF